MVDSELYIKMIDIFRVNSCEGSNGLTIRIPRPPSDRALSSRATMSDGPSPTPFQKPNRPIVKSQSLTTNIDKLTCEQHRSSSVCSSCRSYFRSRRAPSINSIRERNGVKNHSCIHESSNRTEVKKDTDESTNLSKTSVSSSKEEIRTKCLNCKAPIRNSRSPEKANTGCATDKSVKGGKRNSGKSLVDKFPTRNGFPVFNSCMSLFQVQENLQKGELIEGILLINPKKYEDAYITAPALLGRGDGHLYWRDV